MFHRFLCGIDSINYRLAGIVADFKWNLGRKKNIDQPGCPALFNIHQFIFGFVNKKRAGEGKKTTNFHHSELGTHRRIIDAHMIAVLILVVDTDFYAIRIGLVELLYVWTSMWTRLFEHAMVLLVMICRRILGWGWKVRRWRRRNGCEILTSRLLIIVVGTVEKVFLILLLHMQLQLLLWQSRLIYELRWFHVNMVAGCIGTCLALLESVGWQCGGVYLC